MLGFPIGTSVAWVPGTTATVAVPSPWRRDHVSWGAGAKRDNIQKQGPPGYTKAETCGGCQHAVKHIPLLTCFVSGADCS